MSGNSLKKGRYTQLSNHIGLYSNQYGNYINNLSEVVINFPFKDTILEAGMNKEDAGRDERFLHTKIDARDIDVLETPKVLTNFRYINQSGEMPLTADSSIEFFDDRGELKQNLLIKGNNLLALYSLKERLAGQVKLIYIDPPYYFQKEKMSDTFSYNANFKLSAWLTFMKNRLEMSRELLSDDGVILTSIDEDGQAYLKVLLTEIFGPENSSLPHLYGVEAALGDFVDNFLLLLMNIFSHLLGIRKISRNIGTLRIPGPPWMTLSMKMKKENIKLRRCI